MGELKRMNSTTASTHCHQSHHCLVARIVLLVARIVWLGVCALLASETPDLG